MRIVVWAVGAIIVAGTGLALLFLEVRSDRVPPDLLVTEERMIALVRGVDAYWRVFGRYPSATPSEMMDQLSASFITNGAAIEFLRFIDREGTFQNQVPPVDGWEQPIYVRFQPDAGVFVVGSYGRNKVDDCGGLDDIIIVHTNTARGP